jgi:hypothetical protein
MYASVRKEEGREVFVRFLRKRFVHDDARA